MAQQYKERIGAQERITFKKFCKTFLCHEKQQVLHALIAFVAPILAKILYK